MAIYIKSNITYYAITVKEMWMGIILLLVFVGLPILAIIRAKRKGPEQERVSPLRRRIRSLLCLCLALFFLVGFVVELVGVIFFDALADAHMGLFQFFWSIIGLFVAAFFFVLYRIETRKSKG